MSSKSSSRSTTTTPAPNVQTVFTLPFPPITETTILTTITTIDPTAFQTVTIVSTLVLSASPTSGTDSSVSTGLIALVESTARDTQRNFVVGAVLGSVGVALLLVGLVGVGCWLCLRRRGRREREVGKERGGGFGDGDGDRDEGEGGGGDPRITSPRVNPVPVSTRTRNPNPIPNPNPDTITTSKSTPPVAFIAQQPLRSSLIQPLPPHPISTTTTTSQIYPIITSYPNPPISQAPLSLNMPLSSNPFSTTEPPGRPPSINTDLIPAGWLGLSARWRRRNAEKKEEREEEARMRTPEPATVLRSSQEVEAREGEGVSRAGTPFPSMVGGLFGFRSSPRPRRKRERETRERTVSTSQPQSPSQAQALGVDTSIHPAFRPPQPRSKPRPRPRSETTISAISASLAGRSTPSPLKRGEGEIGGETGSGNRSPLYHSALRQQAFYQREKREEEEAGERGWPVITGFVGGRGSGVSGVSVMSGGSELREGGAAVGGGEIGRGKEKEKEDDVRGEGDRGGREKTPGGDKGAWWEKLRRDVSDDDDDHPSNLPEDQANFNLRTSPARTPHISALLATTATIQPHEIGIYDAGIEDIEGSSPSSLPYHTAAASSTLSPSASYPFPYPAPTRSPPGFPFPARSPSPTPAPRRGSGVMGGSGSGSRVRSYTSGSRPNKLRRVRVREGIGIGIGGSEQEQGQEQERGREREHELERERENERAREEEGGFEMAREMEGGRETVRQREMAREREGTGVRPNTRASSGVFPEP